jgi:hypothetical protein
MLLVLVSNLTPVVPHILVLVSVQLLGNYVLHVVLECHSRVFQFFQFSFPSNIEQVESNNDLY